MDKQAITNICDCCGEPTGKFAELDESFSLPNWAQGPLCSGCFEEQVPELANAYGVVKQEALKARDTITQLTSENERLRRGIEELDKRIDEACEDNTWWISNALAELLATKEPAG